ncbi:MAG TPA: hypothetical protein PLQ88_03755, partial [Blastocatellia bacterium]|nr:hypothetical protein [Blastocatellia bacterium]
MQFERCEAVADAALPVSLYLRRLAADGEVIFSDDTRVKILSCLKEKKELKESERRATNTSGMVIEVGGHRIALYANGRRHAGENLDELLKVRSADLGRPIQMSDAPAANWSGEEETIEAKCLTARAAEVHRDRGDLPVRVRSRAGCGFEGLRDGRRDKRAGG